MNTYEYELLAASHGGDMLTGLDTTERIGKNTRSLFQCVFVHARVCVCLYMFVCAWRVREGPIESLKGKQEG